MSTSRALPPVDGESTTVSNRISEAASSSSSQSAARAVPFIGKLSAIVEQQVKVWNQLDSVEPLSSALACTVMLHSRDGHMEEFVSAARSITQTLPSKLQTKDIGWTVKDKHANLMAMQKLWRHDNRQELNSKRREARQRKKNGSQKSSSPSSSVFSDCDGESIQPLKELQANHVQHSTNTKSGPSREHGRKRRREEAATEHEPAGAIDREDGSDVSIPEGNSELIKKQKVADQPRTSNSVSTTPVGQKPNTHAFASLIQKSPRTRLATMKSPAAPAAAIAKSNVNSDDGGPECHKNEERKRNLDPDEGQNCAKNPAAEEEPEEDSEEPQDEDEEEEDDEDEEEEDDEEEEKEEEGESDSDDGKESITQFLSPRRTEACDEYMRAVKTGLPSHKEVNTAAPAIAKSAGYNSEVEVEGSGESELDSEDEREGSGEKSKNSMVEATALVGAAAASLDRQPQLAARSAATIKPHVEPTKAVPARRSAEERAADEAEEAAAHSLGWGPPPQSRPLLKRSSRKSKRRDRVVASQSSSAPAAVSQAVITSVPSLPAQRLGPYFLWKYDSYVCRTDRGLVGLRAPMNAYELWKAKGEPDANAWHNILEDQCLLRQLQDPTVDFFAPGKWHWSPTSV